MSRCPACESLKVLLVLSDVPRAECERCHATWIQDGVSQHEVRKPPASREAKKENVDGT
jgi:hypothetical protein